MPWVDAQVHLSDLLILLGGAWAFIKVMTAYRDLVRDLGKDVKDLRTDVDEISERQGFHHEWLIRSGLDRRTPAERRSSREFNENANGRET